MSFINKNTIRNWFKTGLKPTQTQFWSVFDSFFHKEEKIPMNNIQDIESILSQKADQELLSSKVDKQEGKALSSNDFSDSYKYKLDNLSEVESKYLSLEKEQEIKALGGIGHLKSHITFNGLQFIMNKHIIGNNWLEVIMENSGEIASGIKTPYKIVSMKVHKLFGFLTVNDSQKNGAWTDYGSQDSSPYVGHLSTRSFTQDDTLAFTKTFEGDLELFYVGDTDGGIMEVIIDDLPAVFVDTYSENTNDYRKSIFIAKGLVLKEHTITIRNTGTKNPLSTNYQTWFNAFKIHSKNLTPKSDLIKLKSWKPNQDVNQYDEVIGDSGKIYMATNSGITGNSIPTHTTGSVSDGVVTWAKIPYTSFEIKDFYVLLKGSELEYAYQFSLTNQQADVFDVGGNLHGNEFLNGSPELMIEGSNVNVQDYQEYQGDLITLKQPIICYEGEYTNRVEIAQVEQLHQFSFNEILVNINFHFLTAGYLGYFYTAMFPFATYSGLGSRKQFYKLSSPNVSYNLIDYESNADNLIIGNRHDYIAWAEGNAFVPKGISGVPVDDDGEGKVLIALKCDSKSLNNYENSSIKCGLAVNTNEGDYTGYDTWLSKIYFQLHDTPLTEIPQGYSVSASNKYYVKLF